MNTILFKSVCIKVFIVLNCIVFRLNLVINNSNMHKKVMARLVALVSRSWYFC